MYSTANFLIFMNFSCKNFFLLHFFTKRIKNFDFWNVNRKCTIYSKEVVCGSSVTVRPVNQY